VKRREFIGLLGGAAAALPLPVRAQSKMRSIGYLGSGSPSAQGPWIAAFVQRMRELGWIEGVTFAVEYRWAEGHSERYAEIAAEFVRLNVAVILTEGVAVPAAKRATAEIPVSVSIADRGSAVRRTGRGTAGGPLREGCRVAGNKAVINKSVLDDIKRGRDMPFSERVDQALQFLSARTKVGSTIAIDQTSSQSREVLEDFLAFTESADAREAQSLLRMMGGEMGLVGGPQPNQDTTFYLPKGWLRLDELQKREVRSSQAFVAMWFNPVTDEPYENGIYKAIYELWIRTTARRPKASPPEQSGRRDYC
jgi:hypothetical protein